MHPAEDLWKEQPPLRYPQGCKAVPRPIPGIAFFPGGYGLYRESLDSPLPAWPIGKTMVLGHDFHSEAGYEASLARGHEDPEQPTWREIRTLLASAGIGLKECFFTNIYLGLREGTVTTGRYPGSRDPAFVAGCQEFLRQQILAQQPSRLLSLGVWVPRFLGETFPALSAWRTASSFKLIDEAGPLQTDVELFPGGRTAVAALVHPSFRPASVRHRHYKGLSGLAAETQLLRDAA